MGVNYVSTVGSTNSNEIYVVSSGSYSANGIGMDFCSAIISSGDVYV
jgi:hypothetical protein